MANHFENKLTSKYKLIENLKDYCSVEYYYN